MRLHLSILTCFVFLSLFFVPKSALAACSGVTTSGSISCVLPGGSQVWCATNAECTSYKQSANSSNTSSTYQNQDWLDSLNPEPRQKYFPDQGCDKGINTALGCLPYTIDNFGPTLFGFLVGFAGMIALILMLFASGLYIGSGGDQEKLKKAKELFTAAVTGLLFIIFSVVLLRMTAGDILKIPGF